jgi:hypothetical protein
MEGIGYDSVNGFIVPIESFATQMAYRVWGEAANLPNGYPGGGTAPVFAWNGAPAAAGLSYDGYKVKLDLAAAGTASAGLNAGRYWLNFAPTVAGTNNHFYQLATDILGKTPVAQARCPNVGGGSPSACNNNWKAINLNANFVGAPFTGYAMKVVANATCGAPWMNYSSTSGSLGSNRFADVSVTFNATALAAGTYTAYLCVSGNGTSPPPSNGFIGGEDSKLIPVTLTVGAANVNDAPVFTNEPYNYSVVASAGAGSAVGTLTATDVDAGQTLSYQIASGNTGNAFQINAGTGAITVATPAAVSPANSPFNLRVRVSDNGSPVLSDDATVVVTVTPAGPNTPPVAVGTISNRSDAEGATVSQTTAANFSDADVGETHS